MWGQWILIAIDERSIVLDLLHGLVYIVSSIYIICYAMIRTDSIELCHVSYMFEYE